MTTQTASERRGNRRGRKLATSVLWAFGVMVAGTIATATVSTGSAFAAEIVPHTAIYDYELVESRAGSNIVNASGEMEYEWNDVCDGFTLSQRMALSISYASGPQVDFGWGLNSWEARDGASYRFFLKRFRNGEQTEEIRGRAEKAGDGAGTATFTKPEEMEVDLPVGTLFPTEHTKAVLESFAAGETIRFDTVFDGSGDTGLFEINSVLAGAYEPGEDIGDWKALADLSSWRGVFAFFEPESQQSEPEAEQSLRVFPNGIVSELRLDYGTFVVIGTLKELTVMDPPEC